MKNSKTNKNLFDRKPGIRYNDDLNIGSIIIIVNLLPVKEVFSSIPMIKSEEQGIIYKLECYFSFLFDKNIDANKTKAFIFYASNIVVRRFLIQESNCKGCFCN